MIRIGHTVRANAARHAVSRDAYDAGARWPLYRAVTYGRTLSSPTEGSLWFRAPSLWMAVAFTVWREGTANLPMFPAFVLRKGGKGYVHVTAPDVRKEHSLDAKLWKDWPDLSMARKLPGVCKPASRPYPIPAFNPQAPIGVLLSRNLYRYPNTGD